MMDRLGKCPDCNEDWSGGDIFEELKKLDIYTHRSDAEIMKVAKSMGYSESNRSKFTKLIVRETKEGVILECPNISCGSRFDVNGVKQLLIKTKEDNNGETESLFEDDW